MDFQALNDRVVVEKVATQTKSQSGIVLITDNSKELTTTGTIVAVGPGKPWSLGELEALTKKGFQGRSFENGKKSFSFLNIRSILWSLKLSIILWNYRK